MGKVPPTSASLTLSFRTHISVRRSPGSESHCLAGWLEWQKTLPPLLKDTFREDSDYRDLWVLPCWLPTWEVPNCGHGVAFSLVLTAIQSLSLPAVHFNFGCSSWTSGNSHPSEEQPQSDIWATPSLRLSLCFMQTVGWLIDWLGGG